MLLPLYANRFDFSCANLQLRPLTIDDKALYISLYTCPRIMQFIRPPLSPEQAQSSFNYALQANGCPSTSRLFLCVRSLTTTSPLALCSISHLDRVNRVAELGCIVSRAAQGKCLAQHATLALMQKIKQELAIKQFIMDINPNNLPAIRAAKSIGFRQSRLHEHIYHQQID